MPFEADPQLTAAVEDALTPVTADPSQVGTNVLDTTLHFRDLTTGLIDQHLHNLLVADIEDLYDALDLIDLTHTVLRDVPAGQQMNAIRAMDDMFGQVADPQAEQDGEL
ncbi:hypothetical protein [Streptomyces sp. AcH 505]|uniref:hypothetical protein n=1 Tax=Streptomyces sp. AcH 505 TaxID=352211 RepID=UPI0012FE83C9